MPRVAPVQIHKIRAQQWHPQTPDLVAVEEPLEIRLGYGPREDRQQRSVSVTMRTPGHDFELATGFLFTEGIISQPDQVYSIRHCTDLGRQEVAGNIVRVELTPETTVGWRSVERNFYTTSSCGVCGKASIDAVRTVACSFPAESATGNEWVVEPDLIHSLPVQLRQAQTVFEYTGGLHAAALFDRSGQLLVLREDVGRHNAFDKVIGVACQQGWLPLREHIVFLSGRISFELVQKAVMAGASVVAAVGAPSSLAIDMADEFGLTLLGFVRNESFNVYTGAQRIAVPQQMMQTQTIG